MKGTLIFAISTVDIIDNLRLLMHLYKVILFSVFIVGDSHFKDPYEFFQRRIPYNLLEITFSS